MDPITLTGIIGFIVTAYAISVERKSRSNPKYVALCDISNSMSCSRVLTSEYSKLTGRLFGLKADHPLNLPNTYFGLIFYSAVIIYPYVFIPYRELLFFLATSLSMMMCVYLAYILYFKLNDFCVVCVTTYVINAVLFYYAINECFGRLT